MKKAAVMAFPGFCLQEISCLTELFACYGKPMQVLSAGPGPVESEDHFRVVPDKTFDAFDPQEYDCLVLAGFTNFDQVLGDERNIAFLRRAKSEPHLLIAAICASPLLLGAAGILDEHLYCAGLYEESIDRYTFMPRKNLRYEVLVEDGRLITAQGFAFREFAAAVARRLGLPADPDEFGPVTPEKAARGIGCHMPEELQRQLGYL